MLKGPNAKLRALPARIPDLGTGPCPLNTLRSLVQTPFQELWGLSERGDKKTPVDFVFVFLKSGQLTGGW